MKKSTLKLTRWTALAGLVLVTGMLALPVSSPAADSKKEKEVRTKDLPEPVAQGIEKVAEKNRVSKVVQGSDKGKSVYKATFETADGEKTAFIDPYGALVQTQVEIRTSEVPAAVMEAAEKEVPRFRASTAAKVDLKGKVLYDLFGKGKEGEVLLTLDEQGKVQGRWPEKKEGEKK